MQQINSLRRGISQLRRKASNVATGARQTFNQPGADRIAGYENNANDRCRTLGQECKLVAGRDNNVHPAENEFR
jgi:hypothetical protein